jgi:hypothetical protein
MKNHRMKNDRLLFILSPVMLAPLCLSACFATTQELSTERQQRVAAQKRAQAAKLDVEVLRRQQSRLRQEGQKSEGERILRLEQEQQSLQKTLMDRRTTLKSCRSNNRAKARPQSYFRGVETRVWEGKHRFLRADLHGLLVQRLPKLESCYRQHGWDDQGAPPLRGAFWVLYGLTGTKVVQPYILASTFFPKPGIGPTRTERASKLLGCITGMLKGLRIPQSKNVLQNALNSRFVRVAHLLVVADSVAAANRIRRPTFSWPWRKPVGKYAQKKEVCKVGERRGLRLFPTFARPCAPALKCCYPCGVGGCNSVCLPGCGGPRP